MYVRGSNNSYSIVSSTAPFVYFTIRPTALEVLPLISLPGIRSLFKGLAWSQYPWLPFEIVISQVLPSTSCGADL